MSHNWIETRAPQRPSAMKTHIVCIYDWVFDYAVIGIDQEDARYLGVSWALVLPIPALAWTHMVSKASGCYIALQPENEFFHAHTKLTVQNR